MIFTKKLRSLSGPSRGTDTNAVGVDPLPLSSCTKREVDRPSIAEELRAEALQAAKEAGTAMGMYLAVSEYASIDEGGGR